MSVSQSVQTSLEPWQASTYRRFLSVYVCVFYPRTLIILRLNKAALFVTRFNEVNAKLSWCIVLHTHPQQGSGTHSCTHIPVPFLTPGKNPQSYLRTFGLSSFEERLSSDTKTSMFITPPYHPCMHPHCIMFLYSSFS